MSQSNSTSNLQENRNVAIGIVQTIIYWENTRQKNLGLLEGAAANVAANVSANTNTATGMYLHRDIFFFKIFDADETASCIHILIPRHSHSLTRTATATDVGVHSSTNERDEKSRSVLLKQNDFTLNSAFLHAIVSFLIRLALGSAETEDYSGGSGSGSSGGGSGVGSSSTGSSSSGSGSSGSSSSSSSTSFSNQAIKLFRDICLLYPSITQGMCDVDAWAYKHSRLPSCILHAIASDIYILTSTSSSHTVSIPHYDKLLSATVTPPGASAVSATSTGGISNRDSIYGALPPNTLSPTDASGGGGLAAQLPLVKISDGVLYIHLQILNASLINGMSKIVLKSLSGICKLFAPIFQSLNTNLYSLFKTFITKVMQVRLIILSVFMLSWDIYTTCSGLCIALF